ncbi:branched-chain amino acid aminotransferase [Litchfieldia alkalitelluris]|uniref:branched-chain amino acid aminotransferase n=1 Tax=Litchfieldia alkalitelluris TaxID=304268 RepID=UPI001F15A7D4|nr:branched-chain amino acid aminotransferase [Litchfieldia alkalitelluris]
MLKEPLHNYLSTYDESNSDVIGIFKEEDAYLKRLEIKDKYTFIIIENSSIKKFKDAYIELCDKESENVVSTEGGEFLEQSLQYLKVNKNLFVYLESNWFDVIGVDSVSLELDDVFGHFDFMLGFKVQKKHEQLIKTFLNQEINESTYDLMFSQEDGLWSLNIELNGMEEFNENMSIAEAYNLLYRTIFRLKEFIEDQISH